MRTSYTAAAIFCIVAVVNCTSPISLQGDSRWTIPQALSILHEHKLNLDEYASLFPAQDYYFIECVSANHVRVYPVRQTTCPGGHFYYLDPIAVPILAAPLVAVLQVVVHVIHPLTAPFIAGQSRVMQAFLKGDFATGSPIVEILIASFFIAVAAAVLFIALRQMVSFAPAVALALAFAFGTSAWSLASRALFSHAPSILLNGVLLLIAVKSWKCPGIIWLLGPLAALAFFVRPTNAVPLCVLGLFLLWRAPRQAIWAAVAALPVVALFVAMNVSVYGTVLAPYFYPVRANTSSMTLNANLPQALLANWISPGRGLLVYSPFFLLLFTPFGWRTNGIAPEFRRIRPFLIAIVVLHWLLVSAQQDWWAGYSYGPRYMSDLLPYLIALLAPAFHAVFEHRPGFRFDRAILAAFLAIALFIHARGAYSVSVHAWNSTPVNVTLAPSRVWDWTDPPFLRGL
jgi:hypothetical protein